MASHIRVLIIFICSVTQEDFEGEIMCGSSLAWRTALGPRAICLIAGAFITSLLFEQSEANLTSISGTIVDTQGRGISAAHVSLIRRSASNPAETTSDLSGHFSFREVKSGLYSLVVSANGFQNLTRPVYTAQDAKGLDAHT